MKLKLIGSPIIEGTYDFHDETLKEMFHMAGGQGRPRLIQVGGALGPLYKDYDIQLSLTDVATSLYEPSVAFFKDLFCPIDYMRFMVRFLVRELNIVNATIRDIHDIMTRITTGNGRDHDLDLLKILLATKSASNGESMLKKNLTYVLNHFPEEVSEHLAGYCRESICRSLFEAQCINACPAHIHIPGFVALMKDQKVTEAYRLMRQENPLSSICGSICARPCEQKCRRGEITSTVGVRSLQRFISNAALVTHEKESYQPDNGFSIGVIGAGPAGLTAAYFLRRSGYAVTIYEKEAHAGGTLAYGVPAYRLPSRAIETEVATIISLGVDIHYNCPIDQENYLDLKEKHDRIILATGTTIGRCLPLEHDRVMSGIEFLKAVRLKAVENIGKKILVVGGGDVAMDCARTARRLGAQVQLVSLESLPFLPASAEEEKFAREEGVEFYCGYGIQRIEGHEVILNPCLSVYDDGGRFEPSFDNSELRLQDIDAIITCVGQVPDLSYLPADVEIKSQTLDGKVFAAGDMIKPTVVIDAIAQGKSVAALVDKSLVNQGLYVGEPVAIPERVLNIRTFDFDLREEATLDMNHRLQGFQEVTIGYTLEDALYEAERCMRCDRNSIAPLLLGR